jgi:hypothetical protein
MYVYIAFALIFTSMFVLCIHTVNRVSRCDRRQNTAVEPVRRSTLKPWDCCENERHDATQGCQENLCVTKLTSANMLSSEDEDEYIAPARKKPRLQCWIPVGFNFQDCQIPDKALFPAIAAEADTLNASPDNANVAVASASAGAGEHPVMAATHLNARATGPPYREWIPEEDAKLTSAVKTTGKKKYGEDEYKTDWVAIAVQVPGRTRHIRTGVFVL